MKKNHSVE
jgi:hypothetical protein